MTCDIIIYGVLFLKRTYFSHSEFYIPCAWLR